MTPIKGPPCSRGLDVDCFRAQPVWAKQAFAARLVHLLAPPQVSRKLQKILRPALIAPGVALAPGIELPPGVTVTPDATFPPGWTPGDPLPPGVIQDPVVIAGDLPEGPAAPPSVAPWQPGPINQPGKQPPPAAAAFFSEPFDNLSAGDWSDLSTFGGVAEIVSGHLKLWGPDSYARGWIQTIESAAFPANWSVAAAINYQSGAGTMRLEINTGTYRIRMTLTPPDEVTLAGTPAGQTETVDNYLGTEIVWRIKLTGSTATVYMDDVPVIEDKAVTVSSSNPGQINLRQYAENVTLWDYFNLTEP